MTRPDLIRGVILAFVVLVAGCGLFSPRDPRPGGGAGVNCLTPNSPNDVVSNILSNYGSLPGVTCYASMIDTSFTFHPDDRDSTDAGTDTVYAHWTRDIEVRVAGNIAADDTSHLVVFDSTYANSVISPGPPRTELRFYAYHINIHAAQSPDTLYQGRAEITFTQGSDAQWRVTNWKDQRDTSGFRTWGYLRRIYRVGF